MKTFSVLAGAVALPATTLMLGSVLTLAVGCDNDPTAGKTQATSAAPAKVAEPAAEDGAKSVTLDFDESAGKVEFVGAKVTGKHAGGFKAFSGKIQLVEGDIAKSRVEVTIDMKSLFADHPKLEKHLASPDFFDVEKFPTSRFVSTKIAVGGEGKATHTVTGNLMLHGVEKSITFPATLSAKGESVTIAAEFGINRKDHGVSFPGMPDDLIKDEVLLQLDLKVGAS